MMSLSKQVYENSALNIWHPQKYLLPNGASLLHSKQNIFNEFVNNNVFNVCWCRCNNKLLQNNLKNINRRNRKFKYIVKKVSSVKLEHTFWHGMFLSVKWQFYISVYFNSIIYYNNNISTVRFQTKYQLFRCDK